MLKKRHSFRAKSNGEWMKAYREHLALALLVSLGLSAVFSLAFGVFVPASFLIVSSGVALVAGIIGSLLLKRLWMTAVLTAMLRCAVFIIAIGPS